MSAFLIRERQGAILTVTMNRPETRNAISDNDAIDALVACCDEANRDESIRVLVLTGAGAVFSSGGNVKAMRALAESDLHDLAAIRTSYRRGIQRLAHAFQQLEVPAIAAINGPAIGAGTDLACMCDIRIAADGARFAESFITLGLVPGDGGAWFLPQIVGAAFAAEMSFTGDPVDAQTALRHGLVSRVVPAGELLAHTHALAGRIARHPGTALRLTKRLLREGRHASLDTLLDLSASYQAFAHATPDHRAAVAALFAARD
ncbi:MULTISPECIES: crotonase/enoyl-CoA hydratase family protein [unclassified Burkholderia]|uniref:crotonase/enoyl-CoA hydratase family protein n=1 Tax=unclassified Burkholderia TaxID=2613784 RepID=UPI001E374C4E|nr:MULTISPECIES: crotonase/enoyl-CoA hydratase family protein [unclassified Burkholderia]UEP30522.1 crotonase/enoyl-CoA hydratase family protein [Burkholderia sp. B21-007]UEP44162.1 crotonase/enoyl-CoA hydratase family protein [Burkholderia sp. B21-005]